MKKYYLLLLFIFIVKFSVAQEIQGVTVTGIPGVTKSVSEIIAHQRAHPTPDILVSLRPELKGPEPIGQNPNVRPQTSTLGGSNTSTVTNSTPSTIPSNNNFLAIWGRYGTSTGDGRESPYTPPDNCGDVGATQVIATANCIMKVFAKPPVTGLPSATTTTGSGTTPLTPAIVIDLNSLFYAPQFGINGTYNNNISDPHVRYDRFTDRWFIVAIDIVHKTNNYCCIAVSDAGPLISSTNFRTFYFNISQTGGSSRDFFDYPTLGVDNLSLYIGGNMFRNGSSFSGCNMWVVNKQSLINGSANVTGFSQTSTKTDMYTPQGVQNDDPISTQGYFIGASQSYYSKLNIKRVTYSSNGTPSLSKDLSLNSLSTFSPKTVPTLNGTSIDGNDRRLCAAMIKKSQIPGSAPANLWIAQGARMYSNGVSGTSGDRDGAYWAEIGSLSSIPVIIHEAYIYDGRVNSAASIALNYIYPTIALSGQGHNLIGFTSAGASKYCQAATAYKYRTQPGFNTPVDFTNSTSSYNPGASRWGDFTQTVVDPQDDMTMWTFSEYAATLNSWGVRAAQFAAPPPATPALVPSTPLCGTSTVTINGTSTNNSEFFDPGTGYAKRLQVAVSGPSAVTVTNVTFVSPTQITATFTLNGTVAGPYTVTVTNPDGQSASTTFTLATSCGALKTTNLITTTTSVKPAVSSPTVNSSSATNNVAINSTTVQKNMISKTSIYPNPVHDVLNLINANSGNSIIQLLDYKSHILQQIQSASTNSRLNVSNLAAGIYMVKIISGNKVEIQKFVKN